MHFLPSFSTSYGVPPELLSLSRLEVYDLIQNIPFIWHSFCVQSSSVINCDYRSCCSCGKKTPRTCANDVAKLASRGGWAVHLFFNTWAGASTEEACCSISRNRERCRAVWAYWAGREQKAPWMFWKYGLLGLIITEQRIPLNAASCLRRKVLFSELQGQSQHENVAERRKRQYHFYGNRYSGMPLFRIPSLPVFMKVFLALRTSNVVKAVSIQILQVAGNFIFMPQRRRSCKRKKAKVD